VNLAQWFATRSTRRVVLVAVLGAILVAMTAIVLYGAKLGSAESSINESSNRPINLGHNENYVLYQQSINNVQSANNTGRSHAKPQVAPSALLQTPSFARTIEDLLGDVLGSSNLRDDAHGFRARLAERVRKQFAPELAEHAIAFVNRYLNYLESLDALNLPSQAQDVAALRNVFETRKAIRQAHFSPEEYEALFARDDRLDRYTLARFEIQADTKLTSAEKTEALNAVANELTPEERQERANTQAHLALQRQTEVFDKQRTSEEERFTVRAAEHGEAAAQRLAELDRVERDWHGRLAQYEQAQRAAREGAMTNEQLAGVKQKLFDSREQLRLEAALALRQRKT
jgi:lipase chaperone LimK